MIKQLLIVKLKTYKQMKKKYLLLSVLFLSSIFLNAQEDQSSNLKSNHELSIIVDNVFAKNNLNGIWYTDEYGDLIRYYPFDDLVTPEMGLGYKFHLQGSEIRVKLAGMYKDGTNKNDDSDYKNENTYFSSTIALGYVLHQNMNKTQFFYGLDICMKLSELKSKNTNESYFYDYDYQSTYTSESIKNYTAYGIAPVFGIRFYLNPSFSLSTELKCNVLTYKEEHIHKSSTSDEDDTYNKKGIKTDFGPLGQISFNIHL